MRLIAALASAFAFVTSSPISAPAAPPEELPETRTVADKTDVTPIPSGDIRQLVESGNLADALEKVRLALSREPTEAQAGELKLLEARLLDQLGRGWDAIQVYREILEDPVRGGTARRELHALLVRRGQFSAAQRLTEADSAGTPSPDPESVQLRGFALWAEGRFGEAEALLAPQVDDPRALATRAAALLALGRRDEAQAAYLAVLELPAPRDVLQAAHYGLAQVARLSGARAIRVLEDDKAARLGPMPLAELDRGLGLRALGRRDEADDKLEEVARTYGFLASTAKLALARLDEEEGRSDRAIEHLADGLTGGFADFRGLTRLGDTLKARGDEEAAIASYREALAVFPSFPPAQERLGQTLVAQGRYEETPEPAAGQPGAWVWERLLDGDLPYHEVVAERDSIPLADPRRIVLAVVQLAMDFPGGALAWTEGAGPQDGALARLRAEALERSGRHDDAGPLWEAILAADESVQARECLARAAIARKDQPKAVELWEELTKRHPGAGRAQIRLAADFDKAGWKKEAKEAYDRGLSAGWLSPDERRRARAATADLADEVQEAEESRAEK